MKILIVEDEYNLADVLRERLEIEGYEVAVAENGDKGYELAMSETFDLIIMDGMLPDIDGMDIIRDLRTYNFKTPILMLSARTQLADRINGLDAGADDYLTKPFEMEELLARLRVLLRRNYGREEEMMAFGNVALDVERGWLYNRETAEGISLSEKELHLFEYLLLNKGRTLSRMQISDRIWGYEDDVGYNNVSVYLTFLRRKLKHIGANVGIRAVRGVGYQLVEAAEDEKED